MAARLKQHLQGRGYAGGAVPLLALLAIAFSFLLAGLAAAQF